MAENRSSAIRLLRDPDPSVQVIVLNILRNIACNEWSDIDLVVRGIGEARLYSLIEEALWSTKNDILTNVCPHPSMTLSLWYANDICCLRCSLLP